MLVVTAGCVGGTVTLLACAPHALGNSPHCLISLRTLSYDKKHYQTSTSFAITSLFLSNKAREARKVHLMGFFFFKSLIMEKEELDMRRAEP